MKKRFMALFAVVALGLVPVVAGAVETPAPVDPATATKLVKAYSTVVAVTGEEGSKKIELQVEEAYEWLDGGEVKNLATALNGQHIVASVTPNTKVLRNETPIDVEGLQPGMKVKAIMTADVQPATPTSMFTLLELYHAVPKPHPGAKFEGGFFPRLWHTRGQILGADRVEERNILNVDVRNLENAPKRFRDEGSRLVHLDAYVIVPERVVITDVDGRRIAFADLKVDDKIKIVGKFLRPESWMRDESGEPTPTLLAKRIKVRAHAAIR